MAVTNPQAISFCNDKIRRFADLEMQLYRAAKQLYSDWFATGVNALIPNDSSQIEDGSSPDQSTPDGRTPITGAAVTNIVTRASEVIADMEASGNAKLNTVSAVYVNGTPPF